MPKETFIEAFEAVVSEEANKTIEMFFDVLFAPFRFDSPPSPPPQPERSQEHGCRCSWFCRCS
jgi:hypothetical protein